MTPLWVALVGGLGAGARFVVDGWVTSRTRWRFPVATLLINVVGSGLLGLLVGWAGAHPEQPVLVAVLGTGFLGGFTTFSTASVELVPLFHARPLRAVLLALTMLGLALGAAWVGVSLGGFL